MYAGIDFDTNTVHVVLLPEAAPPRYLPFALEGQDVFERARDIRDAMPPRGWWNDEGVIAIGIEDPMQKGPASRTFLPKLKMIQGAILACLPRGALVQPLVATQWRKEVGLSGRATKEEVAEFVYEHQHPSDGPILEDVDRAWWDTHWPQDAADAYCLALVVEKLTEPV